MQPNAADDDQANLTAVKDAILQGRVVDFDGCVRKTQLWKTFERYARTSGARLINVVPHYVNQDMRRIAPNSLAAYSNTKQHGCISPVDCPQEPCSKGLVGHLCVVLCTSQEKCWVGPAADNAAEALETVYGERTA